MVIARSPSQLLRSAGGGLPVPRVAKLGAVVIAVGLLADVIEHTLVPHVHDELVGAFPLGEHAAHFIVLLGMVLVLVAIVADGVRAQRRRGRQEESPTHAVR